MREVIWNFSFVNTYFCTSTSLNPELQLVIFSPSLKLICSLLLAVNTETMVPSKHANTQGKTYQQKGKVLLKGWPVAQGFHADCVNGRRRGGRVWSSRAITKKTTFWTQQMAQQEVKFLMFSTEGTTQWAPQTIKPESWTIHVGISESVKILMLATRHGRRGGRWVNTPVGTTGRGRDGNTLRV